MGQCPPFMNRSPLMQRIYKPATFIVLGIGVIVLMVALAIMIATGGEREGANHSVGMTPTNASSAGNTGSTHSNLIAQANNSASQARANDFHAGPLPDPLLRSAGTIATTSAALSESGNASGLDAQQSPDNKFEPFESPAAASKEQGHDRMSAVVGAGGQGVVRLTPNDLGLFPRVPIGLGATAPITVSYPEAMAGDTITIQSEDGGQINGSKTVIQATLDDKRTLRFNFTSTQEGGIYHITLRRGFEEKRLELWGGPAPQVVSKTP